MKFHTVNKAMYQSLHLKIENILYSGHSLSSMLVPYPTSPNKLPHFTYMEILILTSITSVKFLLFLRFFTNGIILYVLLYVWHVLLNLKFVRFIYIVYIAVVCSVSLYMYIMWLYEYIIILGCLNFLAIMSCAAMYILVYVFWCTYAVLYTQK